MESNSDKEMRDKLRGVELPFDPKAWEQMDAMLEKDRKPKAFIWWWTGGIAAALILGAVLFGYNQLSKHNAPVTVIAANPEKQNNITVSPGLNNPANNNSLSNNTYTAFKESTPSSNAPKTSVETAHKTYSKPLSPFEKEILPVTTRNPVTSSATKKSAFAPHSKREKKQNDGLANNQKSDGQQQAKGSDITASAKVENQALSDNKNETLSHESIAASIITQAVAAADLMLTMKPDALTSGDKTEDDIKKKDEDIDLKKLKKKVAFTYSLGLAANLTGSTLGNQGNANIFTKKPSYMIGLTQDFMFLKRFAVTTGFMFSQTSFTATDFNYSCNITELNIPVGVKAYLISKSKVRFYLDAGIINHFKLKETFASLYNNSAANLSGIPGYNFGPVSNATGIAYVYSNSFSGYDRAEAGNYSINQGKRYYASFYTGAGAEFIVKSHLIFFTEPVFYMSLEKIPAPERYKYDLGLSGGFRYQF
jgi:hypothetical protein